ncbi:MAG TPA: hypothetical protein VE621_20560 [Bryobacteraceae bacterium]|nr:hypothetical protein [Bryobacteraceae bacterium]
MRKALRYGWLVVLVAACYPAFVLWQRNKSARELEEKAAQARAESDTRIVERYASGPVKVLMFYANPGVVARGSTGLVCYGVKNAKTVRIEPELTDLKPSLSRCVEIRPARTTTYTITAEDAQGNKDTQQVEVRVE